MSDGSGGAHRQLYGRRGEAVEHSFGSRLEAVLEAPVVVRRASADEDARARSGQLPLLVNPGRSGLPVSLTAEARIVSEVEVNVAAQWSVVLQHGPAAASSEI
jgi:hypothetical protein